MIRGNFMEENLVFRKLLLEDVYQMRDWKTHSDPYFYHYNFQCETGEEFENWYRSKKILFFKDIFGMFIGDKLIGFITIKNYNFIFRYAEMGISMDLNYTDKGYGTKFISLYLDYVFNNTIFKRIVLRTAEFNKRAIRTYEKVGFNLIGVKECPYEEQRYKKDIISVHKDAVIRGGIVYSDYYFMEILKSNFKKTNFKV